MLKRVAFQPLKMFRPLLVFRLFTQGKIMSSLASLWPTIKQLEQFRFSMIDEADLVHGQDWVILRLLCKLYM